MASPVADGGDSHQHPAGAAAAAACAFREAREWIEAVTGRCFGDKDFRGGLENGILLCELLSSIKPGLVKKINRLPTPIAGLDNLSVFLCGCEELGLKGSQLFDPGDLQDTSTRPTATGSDCSRRIKNVVITIYWLGRAANGCASYNGPTLDLKEFEGLLSQMRKEAEEEAESPVRSVRDSGYVDCWDSERSDSLSPPRHGREDSFDSLDSFGSRSRQTPSPDVPVPRGGSDGRGSDSESDGPAHRKTPDVRKDDMLARRTSVSEPRTAVPFNQYLPNRSNQSGYVPAPLRKRTADKEEGARKSWSTATSPVGGDGPFSTPARSCSEELFHHSSAATAAASPAVAREKRPPAAPAREGAGGVPSAAGREEKRPRQALTPPKRLATPSPPRLLPVPDATAAAAETGRRKGRALSESDDPQRGNPWLDSGLPATVSMMDMRGEEEAALQPHSQVRHELMHDQYNRMKEDDDHWQDDLARWKNRRKSISQDLIKKEEERKMMEQLMTGGTCTSQRRRSIKTYREIVEEKERREGELRDAYRRARTQEEASLILQRYAQRFSISETALERLQLPKLLDRSVSADPSVPPCASPTAPDPFDADGPMKYLRQQSAPAPKFTSTLEARIEEFPSGPPHQRPQIRSRSSEPPSNRALSPKPLPLLTPKPYFQPTAGEPRPSQAAGLLRVNGDAGSDDAARASRGRESPPDFPQASPSKSPSSAAPPPTRRPLLSTAGANPVSTEEARGGSEATAKDVPGGRVLLIQHSTPPGRPTSLPSELQKPGGSLGGTGSRSVAAPEEERSNAAEARPSSVVRSGVATEQNQPVTLQESVPRSQDCSLRREKVPSLASPGSFERAPPRDTAAEFANSVRSPLATSNPKLRREFFVPAEEEDYKDRRGNVSVPVLPQARRGDRWSWDPDGERMRQERWQQEQERMLQEKYRREQEKLKEEWEKAQREVAAEERKYHEEERRILEETVAPLTPRPSALPSPGLGGVSCAPEPRDPVVRSLADWERKQELLERHTRGSSEGAEWKRRDNDRTSDISAADDGMETARSSVSRSSSSSQPETLGHALQNGQKRPAASTPEQGEASAGSDKPDRPAGDRRSGPIDSNMCRSSSKKPAACPPPPDTAPNRSVSGKKLCSSCGQPLGKGAAMIIETLGLYFHIHCFKCGVCHGQLGDTTTGTDVRIRNGLLNCHQCYIRSRSAGQPTTL
uniref:LIM and calponin homology domains-containing protein 1 isoform X2 n=1 Tax=Gasterosteus aculeatus aculeatus TaxID=481459 RepID=UPI001A97EA71|nr:LIM and calponin homology domains-containing protein 1 isoform X2 [Gasterosteus aculeatus aculeatus]